MPLPSWLKRDKKSSDAPACPADPAAPRFAFRSVCPNTEYSATDLTLVGRSGWLRFVCIAPSQQMSKRLPCPSLPRPAVPCPGLHCPQPAPMLQRMTG